MPIFYATSLLLVGPGIALFARHHLRRRRQIAFYQAYNEACRFYHIVM